VAKHIAQYHHGKSPTTDGMQMSILPEAAVNHLRVKEMLSCPNHTYVEAMRRPPVVLKVELIAPYLILEKAT